jgi:hypothetical protein
MTQLGLFEEKKDQDYTIEQKTTVRLGRYSTMVSLKKKRREAWQKLQEIFAPLEGRDILVSACDGSRGHFWFDDLLLRRLKVIAGVDWHYPKDDVPGVLLLRGTRTGRSYQEIRVFLNQLVNVRAQHDSKTKPYYLIDFWNGFGEYPIDRYKQIGCASLHIRPAR